MANNKNQVRVLSGSLKGRSLRYPDDGRLRPSLTRLKSSLFDSLQNDVRDAVFVDLFAGAGAVGIEALSRGASFVHFVENEPVAIECLRYNIDHCGVSERCSVHDDDVLRFVREGSLARAAPAIIFADPPYGFEKMPLLLEFLGAIAYSQPTLIIIEHDRHVQPGDERLERKRVRKYGQTSVSWFIAGGGQES